MKKNKFEALCAQWVSECLDPNDKEALAAFQNWMESLRGADNRPVTVRDVVMAWEAIRERRKLQ